MNKRLQALGLMLLVQCVLCCAAFADQDYRGRNVFNRFTDWTASVGKTPEERDRIINQRVDTRAKVREARAKKDVEDQNAAEKHHRDQVKESLDKDKAKAEEAKADFDKAKAGVENAEADAKQKAQSQRDDLIQSYDKHMNDLRYQYRDDPATLKERLADAEESRKKKLEELDNQLKLTVDAGDDK